MIITPPMFAMADGLPVRTIISEDGDWLFQYLNLKDGIWEENFEYVYNILMGREGDEPTELFKGNLIRMDIGVFADRVNAMLKKRTQKLGVPYDKKITT